MIDHDISDRTNFRPAGVNVRHGDDGSIYLRSSCKLDGASVPLPRILADWATREPDRTFLEQRTGTGWEAISYGEMWKRAGQVGTRLITTRCSADRPLMILANNGIDHAVAMFGAMRAAIPVAPVSMAYTAHSGDYERLRYVIDLVRPGLIYASDDVPADALHACRETGVQVEGAALLAPGEIDTDALAVAEGQLRGSSIAKLMLTSGSTGVPKAVINTHHMLWSNQAALAQLWPKPRKSSPAFVDWLPWNHTFCGNFVFNMVLFLGGMLCIDDGRPAPGKIGRTLEAMARVGPSRYFNVPIGYEALVPELERQPELARAVFRNIELLFCAAASLSPDIRSRLVALLREACGRDVPVFGGWGSTETAPGSTVVYFPTDVSANIGLPIPGTEIKMTPSGSKMEMRVRGDNVMPGYWNAPEATAAAFDEEGFYRMGDAGKLIDPDAPDKGIMFDGRTAENFKLSTGTWVAVGALRLAVIDQARPLIQDVVITGHDRDEIGLLVFLNEQGCRDALGQLGDGSRLYDDISVLQAVRQALRNHNLAMPASSTRIARFTIETEPPGFEKGEITDKGYINQRAVLEARTISVDRLYAEDDCIVEG